MIVWTPDELQRLFRVVEENRRPTRNGVKGTIAWKAVCAVMCLPRSVCFPQYYLQTTRTITQGWTKDEIELLRELACDDPDPDWKAIAVVIGTKYPSSCRTKWAKLTAPRTRHVWDTNETADLTNMSKREFMEYYPHITLSMYLKRRAYVRELMAKWIVS